MTRRVVNALRIALGSVITLTVASGASAQQRQNTPHVGYVYPAGGQRGTTVQVTIGGQFLDGVNRVAVSGRGVAGRVVEFNKPVTGLALTTLRDTVQARAQELQKKGGNDPAMLAEINDLRLRIAESQRRTANPSLAELVTLELTIAPDAEPGERRLRLETPLGLTTPLTFCVGQLPEYRERDVKNSKADMELTVTVPAVVNGRLIPGDLNRNKLPGRGGAAPFTSGDVDRYRFRAKAGDHLVAAVAARELMPYLADAVPGWIQPTLTLLDANGHELAYDDDYRFHPDPVIQFVIPADGEYVLEIRDALYRGRDDFVYRITIGDVPFVTSVFPLGGRAGKKTDVTLSGWNLPSTKPVVMDAKGLAPGIYPLAAQFGGLPSNRMPFSVDTLPEVFEREPNDSPKQAQAVKLPVIINGKIDRPGDWDVFSFTAQAGASIVVEVYARRLESPLDAVLELTDAAGKRLAWNDDHEDKAAGLETHHADSWLIAKLPATGTYYVRLGDIQRHGGPEYTYRLRISPPRPDFELRVSPSAINVAGGGTVPLKVTAIRRDGFDGDIALDFAGGSHGFELSGTLVPAGQDQVQLTLTAPPSTAGPGAAPNGRGNSPLPPPVDVTIQGRATINGKAVTHQAAPADEMTQAFFYKHLVVAEDLWINVLGRGATRVSSKILTPQPVRIAAGGSVQVRASMPPGYQAAFDSLQFQLSEPPDGVAIRDVRLEPSGGSFVLQTDPAKCKPGLRGNLIVEVTGVRISPPNAQAPAARTRVLVGTLPAIAFELTQ